MNYNVNLQSLPGDILILILSYLNLQSLAILESVSSYFKQFINHPTESSPLFLNINLRRETQSVDVSWLLLKILTHSTHILSLSGTEYEESEMLSVIAACGKDLKSLDVSFCNLSGGFFRSLNTKCWFISELIIRDAKLTDDQLQGVFTLPHLKKLRLSNNNFLKGHSFLSIKNPLSELDCDGCEKLRFDSIQHVVELSKEHMTELLIDGEQFSTEQVCSLLTILSNIRKFGIYFANEMDNRLFGCMYEIPWEFLTINKASYLQEPGFYSLFSRPHLNLQDLHLCECSEINDETVTSIGLNCPNLRNLSLTWCMNVHDIGIYTIIQHCHYLRSLVFTGLKFITDAGFPTDPMPKVYEKLMVLNLSQCDRVPDSHLWRIQLEFPRMKILNYYGETSSGWRKCMSI